MPAKQAEDLLFHEVILMPAKQAEDLLFHEVILMPAKQAEDLLFRARPSQPPAARHPPLAAGSCARAHRVVQSSRAR